MAQNEPIQILTPYIKTLLYKTKFIVGMRDLECELHILKSMDLQKKFFNMIVMHNKSKILIALTMGANKNETGKNEKASPFLNELS